MKKILIPLMALSLLTTAIGAMEKDIGFWELLESRQPEQKISHQIKIINDTGKPLTVTYTKAQAYGKKIKKELGAGEEFKINQEKGNFIDSLMVTGNGKSLEMDFGPIVDFSEMPYTVKVISKGAGFAYDLKKGIVEPEAKELDIDIFEKPTSIAQEKQTTPIGTAALVDYKQPDSARMDMFVDRLSKAKKIAGFPVITEIENLSDINPVIIIPSQELSKDKPLEDISSFKGCSLSAPFWPMQGKVFCELWTSENPAAHIIVGDTVYYLSKGDLEKIEKELGSEILLKIDETNHVSLYNAPMEKLPIDPMSTFYIKREPIGKVGKIIDKPKTDRIRMVNPTKPALALGTPGIFEITSKSDLTNLSLIGSLSFMELGAPKAPFIYPSPVKTFQGNLGKDGSIKLSSKDPFFTMKNDILYIIVNNWVYTLDNNALKALSELGNKIELHVTHDNQILFRPVE